MSWNPWPAKLAFHVTLSLRPCSTYATVFESEAYVIFGGRRSETGPKAVETLSAEKNAIASAMPPAPELVQPRMRLNCRAVPWPLLRGTELRSGVRRGTSSLAGASRSNGTRPALFGKLIDQSLVRS